MNITSDYIVLFKSLCIEYQRKSNRPSMKEVAVRPILTKVFSSCGQLDLVEMQAMFQGSNKWIMVYQDPFTQFCVLKAMTCKQTYEVAYQLVSIFWPLGAPHILQSNIGTIS